MSVKQARICLLKEIIVERLAFTTDEARKLQESSKMFILVSKLTVLFIVAALLYIMNSICCVRWDLKGERLATTSIDMKVKVFDFASGKAQFSQWASDDSNFLIIHLFTFYFRIRFCLFLLVS